MSDASSPNGPDAEPQLPPKAGNGRRNGLIAGAAVVVVAAVVAVVVVAVGGSGDSKTVKIGVTDASAPYWKTYIALAKKKLDVNVKLVNFGDYSQPNPALKQKQIDLNQFEHIQYLANYNVTSHDDLQPIGATAVYPLPLYSLKYSTPAGIPAGSKIAIPNDAINEARGLLVLQAAKLLTLKGGGSAFSSTADIATHNVEVVALDASQTAGALKSGSVAGAVVNNNYATSAKLDRSRAIFKDDPASPSAAPYVNLFVARAADKNNKTYLKLAALYHDPSVEKGVQADNGGTAVFRNVAPAQLQAELTTVQGQASAAAK